eukprot:TRINITY_DN63310_c0_g1_i1.p2 TRINITY_DN63310_c0_g1~~TRINITY_DN63310_c0_g1_i1.p2  ORF type:complete len:131 (-),score=21.44 TRINITY_DN63310_c0_g1_i1:18-377(-)
MCIRDRVSTQSTWDDKRADAIASKESVLVLKQKKEREGLEMRMAKSIKTQAHQRAAELSALAKKYNKYQKQMLSAQKLDLAQIQLRERKNSPSKSKLSTSIALSSRSRTFLRDSGKTGK